MSALVVAEHDGNRLKPSTLSTVTAASQLANFITVLVAGHDCQSVVEEAANLDKVSQVIDVCNVI